jgi:hypothetical protein
VQHLQSNKLDDVSRVTICTIEIGAADGRQVYSTLKKRWPALQNQNLPPVKFPACPHQKLQQILLRIV